MVAATSVIERHAQAASRCVEGRALIVLTDRGEVMVLNESGSTLWEILQKPQHVGTLTAKLGEAYRLDAAQAMADTLAFLDGLLAVNAIEVR